MKFLSILLFLISSVAFGQISNTKSPSFPSYAGDTAFVPGSLGGLVYGIRNDAGTALALDGNYIPFTTDATGQLRVAATFNEVATAADGGALPALTKVISGYDGANVQVIKTDVAGELQVDVLSSALPTGAATLAEQQTQTTSLQLIDDTVATTGAAITAKGIAASGTDGTDARVLKTDVAGELQIDVLSSALPTGAATLAEQQTQTTSLQLIDDTVATSGAAIIAKGIAAIGTDGTDARILKTDVAGELQVDVLSSALPTGAATLAEQQTQTTSLQLIDDTVATTGVAITTKGVAASGTDGTDARVLKTDAGGELQIDVLSSALPTGAATLAEQQTQTTSLQLIDDAIATTGSAITAKGIAASGTDGTDARVLKTDVAGELQIDVLSSALPTGAATLAEQQTQTTSLQLIDDTVATTGAAITTKGVAASGTDGTDARVLKTDVGGELQIDVLSSALPTGASTLAEQQTQTTSLQLIDDAVATTGSAITAKGVAASGTDGTDARVLKTDVSGELQIDVLSSALPTGAATLAEQQTQSTSLGTIDAGIPAALGQTTMAASMPVVLASDQSAISVVTAALDTVDFMDTPLLDASVSNIPASAALPLEIVASLAANVARIKTPSTVGSYIGIYTGAAAAEVLQAVIGPGESQITDVDLNAGERVSIRNMENSTITEGLLAINFQG